MPRPVLVLIPRKDFDPTEAAVPWRILKNAGLSVQFATPGGRAGEADPKMVTGEGFGIWKGMLQANAEARRAYKALLAAPEFQRPVTWEELSSPDPYSALVIPGGHKAEGMRTLLESEHLQGFVARFFETGRPLAPICHGVLLAARCKGKDGRSILHGRKVTALPAWMELSAWWMTRWWLGDYYRTYPTTVEAEIRGALASRSDFVVGPYSQRRDTASRPELGFVVRDGNLLTARFPGDCNRFGTELVKMIGSG